MNLLVTFDDINKLVKFNGKGRYSPPEFVWNNTVGVTDITFFNSDKLGKKYKNDIFAADFHNGNIYHFDLSKNRTNLLLTEHLNDKIANSYDELENVIFAQGFGGITDLEVGPDGYLYVLATNFGGGNCLPEFPNDPCISYSGTDMGSVFRLILAK